MKKFTLLSALFLVIAGYSYAQSLVFTQNGEILQNNSTVTYSTVDEYGNMEPHIFIKNQGSSSLFGTLTVTILEEPIGGDIGYCGWGFTNCYYVSYGTPLSSNRLIAVGEEVNPDVEAMDVDPENVDIKVEFKLTFGDEEQVIIVHFTTKTNSITSSSTDMLAEIVQNSSLVELRYNFPSGNSREINIHNIMGNNVCSLSVIDEAGSVVLPDLQKGIYLYSIKEGSKTIMTRKFVVQ